MDSSAYLVWFVIAAVIVNLVIYGGITLAYFLDKHRPEPPRVQGPVGRDHAVAPGASPGEPELHDAA